MKQYMYHQLITALPEHGIQAFGDGRLRELLNEGWKPVRETPMGGGMVPGSDTQGVGFAFAVLILLEKED